MLRNLLCPKCNSHMNSIYNSNIRIRGRNILFTVGSPNKEELEKVYSYTTIYKCANCNNTIIVLEQQ